MYVRTALDQELLPSIIIVNDHAPSWQEANNYVKWLQKKWASFNNIPFVESNFNAINIQFLKRKDLNYYKRISRSEMWRRQYTKTPYLRHLSREELLEHGHKIWYEILPTFITGSHEKPPQEKGFELMERLTHFIEEINHRGIDFREFSPKLHEAFNRLQREGKLKIQD